MPTSMTDSECATMAPNFCSFFSDKVEHIRVSIRSMCCGQHFPPREFSGQPLTSFGTVTTTELIKLISKMPNKSSPLDVLLISLLKSCSDIFAPIVAHLASLSFEQGHFPEKFELAQVLPLLKKPGADCFLPVNYRPISNLSMISKLIERLVHSHSSDAAPLVLGEFQPTAVCIPDRSFNWNCFASCPRWHLQVYRQLCSWQLWSVSTYLQPLIQSVNLYCTLL